MGFFRTLYRETREILGMSPPPENATQRAERVCAQVKEQIGGKRTQSGDDYGLATEIDGRTVAMIFEAEAGRCVIDVACDVPCDIPWFVQADPIDGDGDGPEAAAEGTRVRVASKLYVEGADERDAAAREDLWKRLPTGARGAIGQLLGTPGGRLMVGDGALRYEPEAETLADKSAKYKLKSQAQKLVQVAQGFEEGWR